MKNNNISDENPTKINTITDNTIVSEPADRLEQIMAKLPKYSPREEKINVITHLTGSIISIIAAITMIILAIKNFSAVNLIGAFIFGFSLIYLYVNSTMYHNEIDLKKRVTRQKLDHSSINVLIAGSNTFFLVAGLHSNIGYILCAVNWVLSIASMILNAVNVKKFRAITMSVYILTGWMCIFICTYLIAAVGWLAFGIILAGGILYTLGLTFYAIKKAYMHAVWHFFVLGGSICHIIAAIIILL